MSREKKHVKINKITHDVANSTRSGNLPNNLGYKDGSFFLFYTFCLFLKNFFVGLEERRGGEGW